jgi:hypothetical protein
MAESVLDRDVVDFFRSPQRVQTSPAFCWSSQADSGASRSVVELTSAPDRACRPEIKSGHHKAESTLPTFNRLRLWTEGDVLQLLGPWLQTGHPSPGKLTFPEVVFSVASNISVGATHGLLRPPRSVAPLVSWSAFFFSPNIGTASSSWISSKAITATFRASSALMAFFNPQNDYKVIWKVRDTT